MIYRALLQIVLTASMVNFMPVDATQIEANAGLPVAGGRVPSSIELTRHVLDNELPIKEITAAAPTKTRMNSLGIVTSAQSAIVFDRASGTTLYAKDPFQVRSIGSITKLMTAYVALENGLDLEAAAAVRDIDVRLGGYDYLVVNDEVKVRDLLHASLVGSDNSATMALVRLTGLSYDDFVAQMNHQAGKLGMTDSTFADPTGLSQNNRSNTHDIIRLLEAVLPKSEIAGAVRQAEVRFTSSSGRNYTIPTTDDLLTSFLNEEPYKIIGGKTGYLPAAGYCLAVRVQENEGHDLYVIVLGASSLESRFAEVKGLAVWAYDTYVWPDEL